MGQKIDVSLWTQSSCVIIVSSIELYEHNNEPSDFIKG
jgi:hypothetical protein